MASSSLLTIFFSQTPNIAPNRPRLVYYDSDTAPPTLKGEIPWPSTEPPYCVARSKIAFDVVCGKAGGKRAYHLTAPSSLEMTEWVTAITDVVAACA